jgi:catechol 2,3-dioxygenase-like lactoylglutathione lyase family enzyme
MAIARLMTNICSHKLAASRDFYRDLLGLQVTYDSDWFIQLRSPDHDHLELGILQQGHPLIPTEFQANPRGCYLTFVVDEVDAVYARAQAMNVSILQAPKDEFYGQRRLLLTDPNGLLIDISSPIAEYHPQ